MFRGINTCIPPILRCWMIRRWSCLTFLAVDVLTICALWYIVVIVEETAFAEFREEKFNDILEGAGFYGVCL